MQKEKRKYKTKGTTGATRCNGTDNQTQNVAPLYKTWWSLQGCYSLLHAPRKTTKTRLKFCESINNTNVACSTLSWR
jgi:hypothetical protein